MGKTKQATFIAVDITIITSMSGNCWWPHCCVCHLFCIVCGGNQLDDQIDAFVMQSNWTSTLTLKDGLTRSTSHANVCRRIHNRANGQSIFIFARFLFSSLYLSLATVLLWTKKWTIELRSMANDRNDHKCHLWVLARSETSRMCHFDWLLLGERTRESNRNQ